MRTHVCVEELQNICLGSGSRRKFRLSNTWNLLKDAEDLLAGNTSVYLGSNISWINITLSHIIPYY